MLRVNAVFDRRNVVVVYASCWKVLVPRWKMWNAAMTAVRRTVLKIAPAFPSTCRQTTRTSVVAGAV